MVVDLTTGELSKVAGWAAVAAVAPAAPGMAEELSPPQIRQPSTAKRTRVVVAVVTVRAKTFLTAGLSSREMAARG